MKKMGATFTVKMNDKRGFWRIVIFEKSIDVAQ